MSSQTRGLRCSLAFARKIFSAPQVFTGAVIISPLLISIIWCLYNMIPPFLVLVYAAFGRKHVLSFFCFWAMIASTASIVCSLGLVWWIQVRGFRSTVKTQHACAFWVYSCTHGVVLVDVVTTSLRCTVHPRGFLS